MFSRFSTGILLCFHTISCFKPHNCRKIQFFMLKSFPLSLRQVSFWLSVCAALLAISVQSGELGSADTMHRLQTAHSFWTSQPAVFPNEYPEFGVHGRGGKLYDWYGIGQPLLMLPFDIIGTGIAKLPIFAEYDDTDPTVRNIFVTYSVNTLISVLTALVCFRFLLLLGFDVRQSIAGVLALLFCTTHLHYTQNMMENNYICLLTLAGFCFQYDWLRTGNNRALLVGSGALGLNLLTRLTAGLDLIAVAGFLVLALWFERSLREKFWPRCTRYLKIALPVYAVFLFFDRLYQFYRFGNWTTTYVHYFMVEHRLQDPTLPPKYPWETPFHIGFLGPLISREKSIFLFDLLIALTIILAILTWKRFSPAIRAYIVASLGLVLAYICLYARYTVWSGNFAWGDRYVSTAVELAAFISVPLLLKFRAQLGRVVWIAGVFLISASLITGLDSDLPGLVVAQVTQNIYDTVTGQTLLIPQGSRLIGTYDSVVAFGQSRALVVWQRIIMPDGSSIQIDNLPATDAQGYSGLSDDVDYHTWALIKGVAISTLLGVGTELSLSGQSDLLMSIRESTQDSVNQAGQQITQKNLNIQPTIKVRPGWPLRVIVHKDLVLRPYRG